MSTVTKVSIYTLPSEFGDYLIHLYKDITTSIEHVA